MTTEGKKKEKRKGERKRNEEREKYRKKYRQENFSIPSGYCCWSLLLGSSCDGVIVSKNKI